MVFLLLITAATAATAGQEFLFRAGGLSVRVNGSGRITALRTLSGGADVLDPRGENVLAIVTTPTNRFYPDRCERPDDSTAVITFLPIHLELVLTMREGPDGLFIAVRRCNSDSVSRLDLLSAALTLPRRDDAAFGVCLFPLSINATTAQSPVLQDRLCGTAYRRHGIAGASWILMSGPPDTVLRTIRTVLPKFPALPVSPFGGAWAETSSYAHRSSVFSYGSLNVGNVGSWVSFLNKIGFSMVQFHGGTPASFRFGDLAIDPRARAGGWDGIRSVVDSLHRYGMAATLHTYAFLLDTLSEFVSPAPHRDLLAIDTVILPASVTSSTERISIMDRSLHHPPGMLVPGAILRIGGELMRIRTVEQTGDGIAAECTRGAFGTKVSAHGPRDTLFILFQAYGLLCPVPGSSLFRMVARRHAEIIDRCGFDGLYLDALDAADRFGPEDSWYWTAVFVQEIWNALRRPVALDFGSMLPHLWRYRSRYEAWDAPRRGYRDAVDAHADWNRTGAMLPYHLGWWEWERPADNDWTEGERQDDFIYLLRTAVVTHSSLAFAGEPPFVSLTHGDLQWKLALLQRYFGPGREDAVVRSDSSLVAMVPSGIPFLLSKPADRRLAAVQILSAPDREHKRPIGDRFAAGERFSASHWPTAVSSGARAQDVTLTKSAMEEWEGMEFQATEDIDFSPHGAVGVWVEGDSSLAVLAVRIENDAERSPAIIDRFLRIDFRGWKYCLFVEMDYPASGNIRWPMRSTAPWRYYRGDVDPTKVRRISYFLGGRGIASSVRLRAPETLPMRNVSVISVTVGGQQRLAHVTTDQNRGELFEFDSNTPYFDRVVTSSGPGNTGSVPVLVRASQGDSIRVRFIFR